MTLLEKLKDEELQKLVIRLGVDHLAKHVGVSRDNLRKVMRERSIKDSLEFLKSANENFLTHELVIAGSYVAMARKYKVSPAFVKSLLYPDPDEMRLHQPSMIPDVIQEEWNRLGYLSLVAPLHGVTISDLQRFVKRHGLIKPEQYDNESRIAHTTGRNGEWEYMRIRGLGKECDITYTNPTAPYDVQDPKYGRVNVKTSAEFHYKQRSLPWKKHFKFDLNGLDQCDNIALVCRSYSGKVARAYVIPVGRIRGKRTFYLNSLNMAEFRDCLIFMDPEEWGAVVRDHVTNTWIREVSLGKEAPTDSKGLHGLYRLDTGEYLAYKTYVPRHGNRNR